MATEATHPDHIRWFEDLSSADEAQVGGKGANLGQLTRAGFRVPAGFVVTAEAFLEVMEEAGVRSTLRADAASVDSTVPDSLEAGSRRLQQLVSDAGLTSALRERIASAYERLGADNETDGDPLVAARSSAVGEDGADSSFAGMRDVRQRGRRRGR